MAKYNGWKNYETWCWNLWAENEECSYRFFREMAENAIEDAEDKDDATYELAKALEAYNEENMPELDGVFADLLGAAVAEIDWHEIAGHYIDDLWDEVREDEDSEELSDCE